MQFVQERLSKWIQAAIILVVGILCIVAGASLSSDGGASAEAMDAISMVLGITMIVVGALSLGLAIFVAVKIGKGFAAVAAPGAILLAIGVSLVVAKYAMAFINVIIIVVPYLLIALGAIVLAEGVFTLVSAIKAKQVKAALVGVICAFIVAIAAIVIGLLCVGNDPVIKYNVQLIVFGIIVALVGLFQFLTTFIKLPDTVVVVTKSE